MRHSHGGTADKVGGDASYGSGKVGAHASKGVCSGGKVAVALTVAVAVAKVVELAAKAAAAAVVVVFWR